MLFPPDKQRYRPSVVLAMQVVKFKIGGNFYAYDINSNHILRVEKPVWLSLEKKTSDLLGGTKAQDEEFLQAVQTIQDLREKHQISPEALPLLKLEFPLSVEEVLEQLSTKLEHIVLNVTEQCNFRCLYCKYGGSYVLERSHSDGRMSWEIAKRAVDFMLERNACAPCVRVGFYGGEPLLSFPLLRRLVEYIRSRTPKQPSFSITTNGGLLTSQTIKFLAANDFSLIISLDGPEQIHDRYRRDCNKGPTFARILRNIILIKSIDNDYYARKVGFSVVLCPPYNLEAIIEFFASDMAYTDGPIMFNHVDPFDTTFLDGFDRGKIAKDHRRQNAALRAEYLSLLCSGNGDLGNKRRLKVLADLFARRYGRIHYRNFSPLGESCYPNGICIPGLRRLFVTVDGRFGLCEKMEEKWLIGNVFDGFNKDAIAELINTYVTISSDMCTKCWAVRLCDCCYIHARDANGFSLARKSEICRIRRRSLAEALMEYCMVMGRNPHAFDSLKMEAAT